MRLSTTPLLAFTCLLLAGCPTNEFIGDWRVSVQCLDHERELGHQDSTPVHLEGSYRIAKSGEKFLLQPESGEFKDEFSNCELNFDPGNMKAADGADFDCDMFNPGQGVAKLSGTCVLTHSGRPTPHSVQIVLIENSEFYDGQTNPAIFFSHPGAAHAGWLH